jgi:hypothetical protein
MVEDLHWVEHGAIRRFRSYDGPHVLKKARTPPEVVKHTISVQASTIIASYATIAAGVNDGDAHQTKLGVLGTLASIIGGRSVGFILAVRCGDDVGRFECSAVGSCR